jgi:ATP-dependent Clp protease ATP-binding subunit ClpA
MSLLTASLQPALRVASVLAVDYAPLSSAGKISLDIFGSLFGISLRERKTIRLRPPKYTEMALAIMQKLSGTAERFKQQYIEAELLLYVSLQDETNQRIISKAAGKGSFSCMMQQQLVQDVEKFIDTQPKVTGGQGQKMMGPSLRNALQGAMNMQRHLKDDFTSVEHLLVAALKSPRVRGSGIIEKYGLGDAAIEKAVEDIRGGQRVTSRTPEATYEALQKYGRDLTAEAKPGRLDPLFPAQCDRDSSTSPLIPVPTFGTWRQTCAA